MPVRAVLLTANNAQSMVYTGSWHSKYTGQICSKTHSMDLQPTPEDHLHPSRGSFSAPPPWAASPLSLRTVGSRITEQACLWKFEVQCMSRVLWLPEHWDSQLHQMEFPITGTSCREEEGHPAPETGGLITWLAAHMSSAQQFLWSSWTCLWPFCLSRHY